jgi:hypothetical protein
VQADKFCSSSGMANDIWIQPTHPAFVALEGGNFEAASYIIGCIITSLPSSFQTQDVPYLVKW